MKVLYILNGAFMGGATISFLNLISGLIDKNVHPVVVIPSKGIADKTFTNYLVHHNVVCYKAPIAMSALHKPKSFIEAIKVSASCILMLIRKQRSYYRIKRIVESERPDLIHSNVGVIREGQRVAAHFGIPHILHIREYQDKDFGWAFFPSRKNYERFILRSAAVITITNDLKNYFHLQSSPQVQTIYNGIFSKCDTCLNDHRQAFFLCASRLVAAKGHEDVLEAFIAFHQLHPEYKLLFAGQGDEKYTSRLKQLASKHCPEAVCFLGHRNDVGQLMEQATALIVGSYSEGFGRMTAEACFKGCIVIGRDTGGTKEIIENTNGLMFHNIDMLKQQMIKVASMTPKEYLEIASIAQQRAIEQYSIESNVQQTFALYQQIIDKAL